MCEQYLQHHGILGQKWGVRRYQNKDGSLTSAGKRRKQEQDVDKNEETSDNSRKRKLTEQQKKCIKIGAAAVVAGLAIYGGYKLVKNRQGKSQIFDGDVDPLTGFRKQKEVLSASENLKAVNPHYSMFNSKYNMNCGNCALAFELRMRGLDVEAGPNSTGMTRATLGKFFTNLKEENFREVGIYEQLPPSVTTARGNVVKKAIEKQIKSYGEDARGLVFVPMSSGSHYVSFEKKGDKINFFNSQNPGLDLTKYCFGDYEYKRNIPGAELMVMRLDNLDFNKNTIHEVAQNVGEKTVKTFDTWAVEGENFVARLF